MTVEEMINRLNELDPDKELMILDGFNGGGYPRTINFGVVNRRISVTDAEHAGDCEERVGESVYVIGFGSY